MKKHAAFFGTIVLSTLCLMMLSCTASALYWSTPDLYLDTDDRPTVVSISDVNGDGLDDVVTGHYTASTISVYLQRVNGTIPSIPDRIISTEGQGLPTGRAPIVQTGDLNGDGLNDIAAAIYGDDHGIPGEWVLIFLQRPDHTFPDLADSVLRSGIHPVMLSINDLNNDGRNDIATVNHHENTVTVFYQLADHTFGPVPTATLNAGSFVRWIDTGDLNSDGLNDIVVCDQKDSRIAIYYQHGINGFNPSADQFITTTFDTFSVEIGDLNDDGRNDLAYVSNSPAEVYVSYQKSDNSFAPVPDLILSHKSGARGIRIGDLDSDGLNDVAFTSIGDSSISIFLQKPGNIFLPDDPDQVLSVEGIEPYTLEIGNLNKDGKLDIAASVDGSDQIAIFLNGGSPIHAPEFGCLILAGIALLSMPGFAYIIYTRKI